MKTYRVTVPYWLTLDTIVKANSPEEARQLFDRMDTDQMNEEWQGLLEGCTPEETIEEIEQ